MKIETKPHAGPLRFGHLTPGETFSIINPAFPDTRRFLKCVDPGIRQEFAVDLETGKVVHTSNDDMVTRRDMKAVDA